MSIFERPILTHPETSSLVPGRPLLVEIGPGRGDFLFHLARDHPQAQVVGIEIKQKRFDKLKPRIEKLGLTNILLFCGDARLVLPEKFPESSVEQIYILFSDPWPKKRHARHRLFQKSFLLELVRILKQNGTIFVAHDNPEYLIQIREEFSFVPGLQFSPDGIDFPTFYAEKWKQEGRNLVSFSYKKTVEYGRPKA